MQPVRTRIGRPRLVAVGFLLAFAATVATVLLTGLWAKRLGERGEPGAPAAEEAAPAAPQAQ